MISLGRGADLGRFTGIFQGSRDGKPRQKITEEWTPSANGKSQRGFYTPNYLERSGKWDAVEVVEVLKDESLPCWVSKSELAQWGWGRGITNNVQSHVANVEVTIDFFHAGCSSPNWTTMAAMEKRPIHGAVGRDIKEYLYHCPFTSNVFGMLQSGFDLPGVSNLWWSSKNGNLFLFRLEALLVVPTSLISKPFHHHFEWWRSQKLCLWLGKRRIRSPPKLGS